MKRDTELIKIQVFAGYCHSEFRSRISYIFGAIIAVYVSLMGLYLQKTIELLTYYLTLFVGVPFFLLFLWSVYRDYHENLDKIDKLIQQVNKEEPLPSLRELRKKQKVKSEARTKLRSMEISEPAASFYAGVMVGVLGNFFVSSVFGMVNAVFEGKPFGIFAYWTLGFIVSSALFFQVTKFIMERFGTHKIALHILDVATAIFTIFGIVMLVVRM